MEIPAKMKTLLLLLSITGIVFAEKANDTLSITSLPEGAAVEYNRKVIGTTPLSYKVGEYAFNVQKSSLFSKRLSGPIVLRVSKKGYIDKEVVITKPYQWHSFNSQNHYTYFLIMSNHIQIDLDKISAKHAAMTNEDISKLHESGLSDELIIDKINHSPAAFELELDDIVSLHKAGISDAIIQAMMHAK